LKFNASALWFKVCCPVVLLYTKTQKLLLTLCSLLQVPSSARHTHVLLFITGDRYGEASAIFSGGIHKILTGEIGVADGLAELEAALTDFMAAGE
jgi:hypothetical protein